MLTMILLIAFGWVFALGASVYAVRPPDHLRQQEGLETEPMLPSAQGLEPVAKDDVEEAA